MAEHLQPSPATTGADSTQDGDHENLRLLSRSPHPYHRQSFELLEPSDRFARSPIAQDSSFPPFARESPPASESGTEADDEHFLRGLPAPKGRLHKGLRGKNEVLSGTSTPSLSPAVLEEEGRKTHSDLSHGAYESDRRVTAERIRRPKEIVRRTTEMLLLVCQAGMVASNPQVRPVLRLHKQEILAVGGLFCCLAASYPLRLVAWESRHGRASGLVSIRIPATFDPAPLLYPPLVPVLVSLLTAQNVRPAVLPNLVLSICALPRPLVPGAQHWEYFSSSHWLLSCIPFVLGRFIGVPPFTGEDGIPEEILVLLYPLHQTLCLTLHHLTTTSLLVSELQLLSVALINLVLFARSPQAVILKALLWGGGLGLIVLCSEVIRWGISLARVPKWRFKRATPLTKRTSAFPSLAHFLTFRRPRSWSGAIYGSAVSESDYSTDEWLGITDPLTSVLPAKAKQVLGISDHDVAPPTLSNAGTVPLNSTESPQLTGPRLHTFPPGGKPANRSKAATPSGRRKRAASSSVRAFFSLTKAQATVRKWLYAGYVYLCILLSILVGIRAYVQRYALSDNEPIGWALGYLLGDLPWFRFQVVKANLERWICLPPRLENPSITTTPSLFCQAGCQQGWVQHARLASLGAANTRLLLSAYWLALIVAGLAVVFRLSPIYEVDTRRKVFHFMMVAMFLPTVYVDPAYAALALALVLAIFLLLDLLRASQLPPVSRPIARFLAPYVDGRDLRGPVVISHIFLLVGCAVPLWLSLAALPRGMPGAGGGGWEVPTRDVSMVAGVVCVGLGDAAASLVGRRWGRHKWLWGGGKSLEGSLAFAVAVFVGLMAAAGWLRVGGWPVTPFSATSVLSSSAAAAAESASGAGFESGSGSGLNSLMSVLDLGRLWAWWRAQVPRTAACASLASLTEAVLTGGNDNVVVPVVLWGCVKSLGV